MGAKGSVICGVGEGRACLSLLPPLSGGPTSARLPISQPLDLSRARGCKRSLKEWAFHFLFSLTAVQEGV